MAVRLMFAYRDERGSPASPDGDPPAPSLGGAADNRLSDLFFEGGIMSLLDCGVEEHVEDCLCDVIVTEISKIAPIDPERYWGMRFALGFNQYNLDSDEAIIDCFEALAHAKDTVSNLHTRTMKVEDLENFERRDDRGFKRASKELKVKLKKFVKEGRSMLDAPSEFQCTWADCLGSLTQGRESEVWGWSREMWADIEAFILGQDEWCGYRALMRQFSIGRGPATQLENLYRHANFTDTARAHQCAKALLIQSPRAKGDWIIKKVKQNGLTISREQVISLRARLTEQGLIPKRGILMEDYRAEQALTQA